MTLAVGLLTLFLFGVNANLVGKWRKEFFHPASFAIGNRFFQCLFEFRKLLVAGKAAHPRLGL